MSSNDLIYTFSRGEEYRRMAALLVRSLRGVGRFPGTIRCYLDGITPWDRVHIAGAELVDGHPWMQTWPWEFDRLNCLRVIERPELYRTITLLDSDIIALQDVTPIMERCHFLQRILHQEETWQRYRDCGPGHHQEMYLQDMTATQRHYVADMHPINAGALTWPGHLTKALMNAWIERWAVAPKGHAGDQATLNRVLRFGGFLTHVNDPTDIGNASQTPRERWRDYRLLHFAGFGERLQHMAKLLTQASPP